MKFSRISYLDIALFWSIFFLVLVFTLIVGTR